MIPSRQVLLLGATGPLGRHLLAQALEQGHTVTALVRGPGKLTIDHPKLRQVSGDLTAEPSVLDRLVPGQDVVISTLGRGQSLRSHGLMARLTPGILAAMETHGVKRLLFLSAFGVGESAPEAPWILRLIFRSLLGDIYADKARAEALIRQSPLDWTIVAPVKLIDAPATGRFHIGAEVRAPGFASLTRADAAAAVLSCLADQASIRKRYVVTS